MDTLCRIFLLFLESSFAASVVILFVMAVQKLFRQHISARIVHILWLIVLVRLLVPIFPNSPVSIFQLFQLVSDVRMTSSPYTENQLSQQLEVDNQAQLYSPTYWLLPANQPMPANTSAMETENGVALSVQLYPIGLQIISVVWLAGVFALIVYLTVSLVKMSRRRKAYKLVTDPEIVSIINHCREKFAIKKSIPIYIGSNSKSPYISGLISPWIYLPRRLAQELSHDQLFYIFSHELAHLKRRDIAWNLLGSVVLAIHWLNPLVWLSMKQMKADREVACDAYTLEVLGEKEVVPYGMTMIECVKRFSTKHDVPSLLYFSDSNNQKQMVRRIRMITFFKKGSYKLSTLAILGVVTIGIVTLTNAGAPTTTAGIPEEHAQQLANEEQLLFDSSFQTYGTLKKAVKVSDFKYKVPETLLDGYQFEQITYYRDDYDQSGKSSVSIRYEKRIGNTQYGSFNLTAIVDGSGLEEAVFSNMEQMETAHGAEVKKEILNEDGFRGIRVSVSQHNRERFHYIWQEQNILYFIENYTELTHQEMVAIINSMKLPDEMMFERDINDRLFIEYIYDTEDLKQVPESIGFNPKFPLQLPGGYKPSLAFETVKVNFSHPDDEADWWTRLFYIVYAKTDQNESGRSSFSFKQIQNHHLYETIKENGKIAYSRIDGKPHDVQVKPIEIEGKEVLVTENYKIDGPLSSSTAPDNTSYFWKENDVCFQVSFLSDNQDKEEIVSYLMNETFIDLGDFN